jgi:hypothetical protein
MCSAHTRSEIIDHRFVRKAIGWLQQTDEADALLALVEELEGHLAEHFAVEEQHGGFFDDVRAAAPHRSQVVDELAEEHGLILDELKELAKILKGAPPRAGYIERAQALSKRLEKHERREEGLLQEIHDRDLDGGN